MVIYKFVAWDGFSPSRWKFYSILPCHAHQYVGDRNITFALVFSPLLDWKQRQDAIAFFQRAAHIQVRQPAPVDYSMYRERLIA